MKKNTKKIKIKIIILIIQIMKKNKVYNNNIIPKTPIKIAI